MHQEKLEARGRSGLRLLACLAALPLGLLLADLGVGKFVIETGEYQGNPLPPFDLERSPRLMDWLRVQQNFSQQSIDKQSCGVFDVELGWLNRQGQSDPAGRITTVNSLGARSTREYDEQPAEGILRLACFGDSFTFGSEATDEEVWCAQLEASDERLEVMNFGVAGYGLDQALLRFRKLRSTIDADVLVIGLQVDGIGRVVNRCRPLLATASRQVFVKPRFLLRGGELELVPLPFEGREDFLGCVTRGELIETLAEHEFWTTDPPWLTSSSLMRLLAAQSAAAKRHRRTLWRATEGEPFRLTLALLEAFRREARTGGIREVVLLLFPDRRDRETRGEQGCSHLEPLRAELRDNAWSWIDLDVMLVEELADTHTLFRGTHFNEVGNARVAEALHSWLLERPGLLD